MNLIGNGDNIYDSNYIMITANLMVYSKSINKTLKKEIDHHKIIQDIRTDKNRFNITYSVANISINRIMKNGDI